MKTELKEIYSVDTIITKTKDSSPLENTIYVVEFKSENQDRICEAQDSVKSLFDTIFTIIVDDQSGNQESFSETLLDSNFLITSILSEQSSMQKNATVSYAMNKMNVRLNMLYLIFEIRRRFCFVSLSIKANFSLILIYWNHECFF